MRAFARRSAIALWIASLLACGFSGEPDEVASGNMVDVPADDPELLAAEAEARASLDAFLADLATPAPGHEAHAVKTAFFEGEIVEHMWVGELTWDGARFHGRIANEPVDVGNVSAGQEVVVERADVEDWMYYDEQGEIVGGYTIRVLMNRQPR